MKEDVVSRFARGAALAARPAPSRARAAADLFDAVQAIAESLDAAGDFEVQHVRSQHVGRWTWRETLAEALDDEAAPDVTDRAALVAYS